MEWESWSAFWAMGGYGAYVWWSFGVTAAVMVGELILVRRRHRAARQAVKHSRRA